MFLLIWFVERDFWHDLVICWLQREKKLEAVGLMQLTSRLMPKCKIWDWLRRVNQHYIFTTFWVAGQDMNTSVPSAHTAKTASRLWFSSPTNLVFGRKYKSSRRFRRQRRGEKRWFDRQKHRMEGKWRGRSWKWESERAAQWSIRWRRVKVRRGMIAPRLNYRSVPCSAGQTMIHSQWMSSRVCVTVWQCVCVCVCVVLGGVGKQPPAAQKSP